MIFQILTIFPERYASYIETGLPARASKKGLFRIHTVQLRDFADESRPGRIDDSPYGGGPGMVVQVGPVDRALSSLPEKFPTVMFTPRGQRLTQKLVRSFSELEGLTLIPGFYEGVDERVAENLCDYEISVGDYILNTGDLAALCLIEAVTRLIPGYMGSAESGIVESNEDGLLEYPQYSRPAEYKGWKVPEILLSGDHGKIADWRKQKSIEITDKRKNELIEELNKGFEENV